MNIVSEINEGELLSSLEVSSVTRVIAITTVSHWGMSALVEASM